MIMRPLAIVGVMLMKVVAPFSDLGSTPSSSTKDPGYKALTGVINNLLSGTADCPWIFDGAAMVSTGSVVAAGGIRKAFSVTKRTIIAKPMTMAAAA